MHTPFLAEVFPVGEILAEELNTRGLSLAQLAENTGLTAEFVSEVISGEKELTKESATQIGAALGTSGDMWLNLQDSYLLSKETH
ncbi:HigA family addiction module antitoxin [Corynebacterium hindlerae]|uniref:HigA family addiction module antitoxin n=1 Tax=Corynebacterium hindlerae TaxID=699041 RepID=UPI0031B6DBF2